MLYVAEAIPIDPIENSYCDDIESFSETPKRKLGEYRTQIARPRDEHYICDCALRKWILIQNHVSHLAVVNAGALPRPIQAGRINIIFVYLNKSRLFALTNRLAKETFPEWKYFRNGLPDC